jgi:hypothetical protein
MPTPALNISLAGDLSKPAIILIEKISDALGGACKPWQLKRVAKAEAEAALIAARSQIELTELQERGLQRIIAEGAKTQENIESITQKALPSINNDAKPQNIEDDWISNFFDKCKLISDKDMQTLWSKVLSGEANTPGTYSKRTVNFISSLDKNDGTLFTSLCGYFIEGPNIPVIFDVNGSDDIYSENNINLQTLSHMESIGLIKMEQTTQFSWNPQNNPKNVTFKYYNMMITIEFPNKPSPPIKNSVQIGHVLLTSIGRELAPICNPKMVPGFLSYLQAKWTLQGLKVSAWPLS